MPKRYFRQRFCAGDNLYSLVKTFRAARFCNPKKVAEMMPVAEDVDTQQALSFLTQAEKEEMKVELPQYCAAREDVHPTVNAID